MKTSGTQETKQDSSPNIPGITARLLIYYRNRARLTQVRLVNELADLDFFISDSTLAMWETARRLPNDSRAFHFLGKCLGLSAQEESALVNAWLLERAVRDVEAYWDLKQGSVPISQLMDYLAEIEQILRDGADSSIES